MLMSLWNDEAGAIVSAEVVLVATILVIGMVVGLKSLRDAVVTELADVGNAIAQLDQSYSYAGIDGHAGSSAGSQFIDAADYCDTEAGADADVADPQRCILFNNAQSGDGTNGEDGDQP